MCRFLLLTLLMVRPVEIADPQDDRRVRWVGTASSEDFRRRIRPLLDREQIPYVPWAKSLGLVEFGSDTPENTLRARCLVEADAHEFGYTFYRGVDPTVEK